MNALLAAPMDAHQQLRSFVSFGEDDELAQMILEELQLARRTFTGVEAEMATSPSCKSDEGLNAISEEDEDAEDDE